MPTGVEDGRGMPSREMESFQVSAGFKKTNTECWLGRNLGIFENLKFCRPTLLDNGN